MTCNLSPNRLSLDTPDGERDGLTLPVSSGRTVVSEPPQLWTSVNKRATTLKEDLEPLFGSYTMEKGLGENQPHPG